MGIHICGFCTDESSSGDVQLDFSSKRSWIMPDMILHYIAEHDFRPPDEFIEDVTTYHLIAGGRFQPRVPSPHQSWLFAGPLRHLGRRTRPRKGRILHDAVATDAKGRKTGHRTQTRGAVHK